WKGIQHRRRNHASAAAHVEHRNRRVARKGHCRDQVLDDWLPLAPAAVVAGYPRLNVVSGVPMVMMVAGMVVVVVMVIVVMVVMVIMAVRMFVVVCHRQLRSAGFITSGGAGQSPRRS